MYDVIVLAGGKMKTEKSGGEYEALVEIAGHPMLYYVVDALRKSEKIDRILVAGPVEVLSNVILSAKVGFVASGERMMDTVKNGIEALGHHRKTLLVTTDIPLLTSVAVDDFLRRAEQVDSDFYYPVIEKKIYETCYADSKRTYVKLKDGTFTGGNIFLFRPEIADRCIALANQLVAQRKKPFKLAAFFGWGFLLKFALGMLTLETAERRFSKLSGIAGTAIRCPHAEVGFDVDRPEDIGIAQKYID